MRLPAIKTPNGSYYTPEISFLAQQSFSPIRLFSRNPLSVATRLLPHFIRCILNRDQGAMEDTRMQIINPGSHKNVALSGGNFLGDS